MTGIVYLNGEYVDYKDAKVHVDDRAHTFGDAVYEVAIIKDGAFIDWQEHCERLQRSLNAIEINHKVLPDDLKKIALTLQARNNLGDAVMYLQIGRGVAPRDHAFPNPPVLPSIYMKIGALKLLPKKYYDEGITAITTRDRRGELCYIKTISLLPNVLAKQASFEDGSTEAIFIKHSDDPKREPYVTEGSSTNVFIVKDDKVFTHPLNEKILGGITRHSVLKVARKDPPIEVSETSFTKAQLLDADEVFLTSTTKFVCPVTTIDDKAIGDGKPGHVTKELMRRYQAHVAKQASSQIRAKL